MKRFFLLLSVVLISSGPALAGGHHGCCADCGCKHGLRKVCRWECEEVEEKILGFACECEDVVIPGKSPHCIQEQCPDPCQDCSPHHARPHHKIVWGSPSDCCVKTVKVLVRKDKTVKKKVWKPVVETVCDRCSSNCAAGSLPPGDGTHDMPPASVPALPAESTTLPPGDSDAFLPPMPPAELGSSRRSAVHSILSALAPTARQR